MERVVEYYTRFQGARGRLIGLPPWARFLLLLASLPGVLLISLSILAFGGSLLALLLLTVPLYRLLRLVTGSEAAEARSVEVVQYGPARTKRVESTVTDAPAADQGL